MGIKETLYNGLRDSFGMYSSWTIWAEEDEGKPKSNIEDMSIFDDPKILDKLNNKYIFVGLNAAKHEHEDNTQYQPWNAFHSSDKKRQQDYKLRYALKGTPYWGSYMTDILKNYPETNSNKVIKYIRDLNKSGNSFDNDQYLGGFIKELAFFEPKPTLIAMGNAVEKILRRHFSAYNIIKIRHYSSWIGKEKYRACVLEQIKNGE